MLTTAFTLNVLGPVKVGDHNFRSEWKRVGLSKKWTVGINKF